jgi:hypothetical protein
MKTTDKYHPSRFRSLQPQLSLLLMLLFMLSSCEEQTSWDISPAQKFPVVDCIITNEYKSHELRLYWSGQDLNQKPEGITGAVVRVSDGTHEVAFEEVPGEAGRYLSAIPFRASAGNEYRLTLSYGGKADTASASMEAVTPLEALVIEPYDSLYRIVYQSGNSPSMTEVYYDWSADGTYCQKYGYCMASEVFYTLDNLDISQQFAPDKQILLFPEETIIIRRKYSLTSEHQRFIRSLLLETEWRGGLFDTEPGNVPTNFRHGVRGWFATCMVLADTTVFVD